MMNRLRTRVDLVLSRVLVVLMGAMVVNVLWQVFTRFVLNSPSSYTEELARFMLVWLGILGAAYASGQKMHLAIELLGQTLEGKKKFLLEIQIAFLVLFFSLAVLVAGGSRLVYITWVLQQTSAALRLPLSFVYVVLPISGLLFCFYAVISGLEALRQFREEPDGGH